MSGAVKFIFRTLIGTIFTMAISFVLIEAFNISVTSMMLKQYTKLSVKKSCELFSQETYREKDAMYKPAVLNADGGVYLSADDCDFYNVRTVADSLIKNQTWTNIYKNPSNTADPNTRFASAINSIYSAATTQSGNGSEADGRGPATSITSSADIANKVPELQSFKYIADRTIKETTAISYPTGIDAWTASESDLTEFRNKTRAQTYLKNHYTPINLGIPYLDTQVITKIARYNLTQLLSNSNSNSIQTIDGVNYFVNYKGCAVWCNQLSVTSVNYIVCDLTTLAGRNWLKRNCNIDTKGLTGYSPITGEPTSVGSTISNNIVYVAEVDYSVPVSYIGITPIRNLYNYIFNRGTKIVVGIDGVADAQTASTWNNATQTMTSTTDGVISVGKLYFTLVR